MRAGLICSLMLAAAIMPSAAFADSVTVTHAKGELTLDGVPQKVAVFDLASLDIIDALGVDAVAGVPKSEDGSFNAPAYLSKYADGKYVGVGTLFEPDIEALKALKPDLIIIAGRSSRQYDAVKDIAPTVDLSPAGEGLVADGIKTTRTLGEIFHVEEKASAEIAQLNASVDALHSAAPQNAKALVLFAVGENFMPHAPGARFGTLYDYIGLASVMEPYVAPARTDASARKRPEPGSPEAEAARKKQIEARDSALAQSPDWIVTLDRGAISSPEPSDIAQRLEKVETVTATPAWKAGQVIHLDPRAWYLVGSGIQNLTNTAKDITLQFAENK
ncbi:iron compound ABC transporter substrate-binding protein [Falsochrobactrum shanghaiense]|uniref:Iron compound ABC transporter substrate-binding protein n=1 Tax=Falsochrobactrum shanghaiense TaxID=2201899 RepID=A0A316JCF4_9HYPH|nr:ABC transporter substrate-binding protein [Falsochrobactrum shanghaiense]PWL18355.1 iron compound ABC transporter substrate-binding protein [Falsochrobactrum shanghaiense]